MAPPLIVRAVLDAASYLKVSESVVSSNTAMADSALGMGADFTKSAEAQVAAGAKVIASQRAQLAQLEAIAAAATAGSDRQIAASVAAAKVQNALSRSTGGVVLATGAASKEAQVAERDLGKLTRGALAGSGVFSKLGRSLAFASTGFIAVAGGATVLAESIRQAEGLAAAQRSVGRQLQVSGKSWDQYGTQIDSVLLKEGHLAGFTRAQLLQAFGYLLRVGGNVSNSLKLVGLATDVARGRSISLQAASIALSKALGGSATALRRLGIIVPNNVTKMQALEYVQKKFSGQAEASTTQSQRLSASLADAGATIGTVVLPTFDRLAESFSNWLQRMNESGKLTKDFSAVTHTLGIGFHTLEAAIKAVDDVTGGFGHTLILIGEIWASVKIVKWIIALDALAAAWKGVGVAAATAGAAETAALAPGAVRAASAGAAISTAGVGIVAASGAGSTGTLVAQRVSQYSAYNKSLSTTTTTAEEAAVATTKFSGALKAVPFAALIPILMQLGKAEQQLISRRIGGTPAKIINTGLSLGTPWGEADLITSLANRFFGHAPDPIPAITKAGKAIDDSLQQVTDHYNLLAQAANEFATRNNKAARLPFTGYTEPIRLQIAGVQAGFTKTLADDVANAKAIIANIQHLIDIGRYKPGTKGYLAALQAWLAAEQQLQSAEQQAAQKRAAAAQKALQIASTYNTPIALQLQEAKLEAAGKSTDKILREIIAAARKTIASGKKNMQGMLAAYQVIIAAQSQLQQSVQQNIIPLRLQLALAKAQALGTDQRPILEKMKRALEKALKAARGNIQKQIDIWNQIASINQQLGQDVTNSYGDYKKASLKWETQGLGLTPAQRRALQARLSQIGPGGTHPMAGIGAAGYIIDPNTGRPITRGPHRRQGSDYGRGGAGGRGQTLQANIDLKVYIDGKQVEAVVTRRQQKNNTRRPTQRRGPNAATR